MIVTHPKIAMLEPHWAAFSGWSLILEGHGEAHGEAHGEGTFGAAPACHGRLGQIAGLLQDFGPARLMRQLLLCLLPPETYHVTFADLVHQGQLAHLTGAARDRLAPLLAQAGPPDVLRDLLAGAPVPAGAALSLRVSGLARQGGAVTLALEPVPQGAGGPQEAGGDPWPDLLAWRNQAVARLAARLDLPPPPPFRPHLTLGYLANPGLVARDDAVLAELSAQVTGALSGLVLTWQGIGLYRFASMARFARVVPQTP